MVVSVGGGVCGGGIGSVSAGGGVLTEGGAARTICLFAHPASSQSGGAQQREELSFSHHVFRVTYFVPRPSRNPVNDKPLVQPVWLRVTRFET